MVERLFSDEKEYELTREYLEYATLGELADREGCHYSTIHNVVKRNATERERARAVGRNKGSAKRGVPRRPEVIEKIRQANTGPRIKASCPVCGQTFVHTPGVPQTYCSLECYWTTLKGKEPVNKIGLTVECGICGEQFETTPARVENGRGKYCSRDCYDVAQTHRRGSMASNWQGGKTAKHALIRASSKYLDWREAVLARDDYTCQRCGSEDNLEVHHIKAFAEYPKLRFALSNGQTLCIDCHAEIDEYRGRLVNGG